LRRERLMKALDKAREQFGFDAIYPAGIKSLMDELKKEDEKDDV